MKPEDLEYIKKQLAGITKGKWSIGTNCSDELFTVECEGERLFYQTQLTGYKNRGHINFKNDIRFIAQAPGMIRELLKYIDELKKRLCITKEEAI